MGWIRTCSVSFTSGILFKAAAMARSNQIKKDGFRKRYARTAIVAYALYQSLIYFIYSSSQDVHGGEPSSVTVPLLSEYKGFSNGNRRARIASEAGDTSSEGEIERNGASKVVSLEDYSNSLERDFSRIPGYLEGSSNLSLFGYVMRDLANRFLSPSSAQQKRRYLLEGRHSPSNVLVACPGANSLLFEIKKKNAVTIDSKKVLIKSLGYRIGESFLVETVFNGHNAISMDSNTGILDDHGSESTDILLAVLDPARGEEDSVISGRLEEHIRSGTIQFATFRISSSLSRTNLFVNLATKSDKTVMQGIEASKIFLSAGYKLQVLSSSHAPTDELNPYGPNTLLKNVDDVEAFLRFGAGLAQMNEVIRLSKNLESLTSPSKISDMPITFHSKLFATRGLDLAIPSRKTFLNLTGMVGNDFILDVEKSGVPYPNCRGASSTTSIRRKDGKFEISCFGTKILMAENHNRSIDDGNNIISAELWHSHENQSLSEASCFKCTKSVMDHSKQSVTESVCSNRLRLIKSGSLSSPSQGSINKQGPNLLAIELRGVSQIMLDTSLARFKAKSESLGLNYFPNFVPSPSTPNKMYDREPWVLWENDVKDDGYQRYRGSNQCNLSSPGGDHNPRLYHGSQMARMFCFDYGRPNCLGGKHTATHLFEHIQKFIRQMRKGQKRWTAYITLIDGVEESETLAGALDQPLRVFLDRIRDGMTVDEWSNTVITIFSNDVQEPILFLKASDNETQLLKEQKPLFTSDLLLIMRLTIKAGDFGSALRAYLVSEKSNTKAHLVKAKVIDENRLHKGEVGAPPSILSFYADIPKEQKFQLIKPSSEQPLKRAKVFKGCKCASNTIPWIPCDIHPWDTGEYQDQNDNFILVDCPGRPIHLEINIIPHHRLKKRSVTKRKESASTNLENINIIFLEIDSVSLAYAERHFPKTRELLKKYRIKRNDKNEYECIEGICSAEFPYTSLVGANSVPNQVAALSGCISSTTQDLCGFDLDYASEGYICDDPNSIHNGFQLHRIRKVSKLAYWCPNQDLNATKTPWLFGVSDSKGYINFFGEEFCYDHSPYVTQGTFVRCHIDGWFVIIIRD